MSTTTNLGLKKIAYADFANVKDINDNFETIDGEFTKITGGILDTVYPVGSIYMSVVSTNPGTLFGGTWTALEDKFLIGTSANYEAGVAGGSATKTLEEANLPSHTHGLNSHVHKGASHKHAVGDGANLGFATFDTQTDRESTLAGFQKKSEGAQHYVGHAEYTASAGALNTGPAEGNTTATGSGTAFDIMPPYLPVYMWKRTA